MLGKVLERSGASWEEPIAIAPFDEERTRRLIGRERDALYDLAAELSELRTLAVRPV